MTTPLDGLVSNLDTTALIRSLLEAEAAPQRRLVAKQDTAAERLLAYQGMNTKLASLRTSARSVADPATWQAFKATSSAPTVATATAGAGAIGGSLDFTVNSLAKAGSVISTGTFAALTSNVSNGTLLLATGGPAVGIRGVVGSGALSLGTHTLKVVQSSAAASKTGTGALAASTIVDGTNDEIDITINGNVTTLTLDAGTYTRAELAAAITEKSGGDLIATIDGSNRLVLTTAAEGSDASIQVTGGDALVDLNLTTDGAAITGTDGKVDLDGVVTDVTFAADGETLSLGGGTFAAELSGGLRVGTVNAKYITTGDGSLSGTVAAINAAGFGVSAAALKVSDGVYRLQLQSKSAGLANAVTVGAASFNGVGSLASLTDAADASITVGSGAGQFTLTSATNTVSEVLPGITLNLLSTGAASITATRDNDGIADKVKGLVDEANTILKEIKSLTRFDTEKQLGALLQGDSTLRNIQQRVIDAVISAVPTSSLGGAAGAGISVTKTGELTFDRTKFLSALESSPDEVTSLFRKGGTATDAAIQFFNSGDRTRAGTYAVVITTAAEGATKSGAGAVAGSVDLAGKTIEATVNGVAKTYTLVGDGLTPAEAAEAVETASNGELTATIGGGGELVITTVAFGASAKLEITGGSALADLNLVAGGGVAIGVNVAGTVNGVAGVGSGRLLVMPGDDPLLAGLTLRVTASAADVTAQATDFGDFTYVPGVAQRIATATNDAIDIVSGTLTAAMEGRENEIKNLQTQIDAWTTRLEQREIALRRQFTAMERALGQFQAQSNWLAGQIAGLQANSASRRS